MIKRKFNILIHVFALVFVSFIHFGCTDKTPNRDVSKETSKPALDNTSDKPLFFELLEPSFKFGALNTFKLWNSKAITDNGVHVFVHPENKKELKPFTDEGIATHAVSEDELKNEWVNILAENKDRKKLIIFIKTHGDGFSTSGKGNFCYRNEHSCLLDANKFLTALKAISNIKNSSLKDVFIVPLSCFNKNIMDRFEEEAKKIPWSFNLTVMSQALKDECEANAFAWTLEKQEFWFTREEMNDQFISKYFKAESVQDLIKLYDPVFVDAPAYIYKITNVTKAKNKINLKEFGFNDLKISFRFHCWFVDLNKPLVSILKDRGVESEAKRLIQVNFVSEASNADINIKGDLNKIFNKNDYGDDPRKCQVKFVFSKQSKSEESQ